MEHPTESNDSSVLRLWKSPKHILLAESQFTHRLLNALLDATDDPGAENRIYMFYNLIISQSCSTVESPLYPDATIDANPQMLFGNRAIASRVGLLRIPINEDNTEDAVTLDRGNSEGKADTVPQPEVGAVPKAGEAASPTRVPDFARILIFGDKLRVEGYRRQLLDFWELKRLKTDEDVLWASDAAKESAEDDLARHVEQAYEAAMAAFDHNPHWTKVAALLIVGIYFTQLVWSRPQTADIVSHPSADPNNAAPPSSAESNIGLTYPDSTVLPPSAESNNSTTLPPSTDPDSIAPLPDPKVVSAGHTDPNKYFEQLADVQEARKQELLDRCMPDIYFFNERVLETTETSKFTGRLSTSFLDALFLPIRDNFRTDLKFVHQPSWFDRSQYAPPKPMMETEQGVDFIHSCLRESAAVSESVQALLGNLKRPDGRRDGFQTPSSASASPFPSPQKGRRRPVPPVPKREFNRRNRGKRIEPPSLAATAQSSAGSSKAEPKPKTKSRAKGLLAKKKKGPKA